MKKHILFLFTVFATLALSAQTKSSTPAPAKKANPPKTVKAAAPKDTSLCSKNWVLVKTEEFGIESKPNKKQTEDFLKMSGDGKYSLKRNGEAKSGTWTRSGAYIFFTDDASKEKFNYKVESAEDKKLKVDYHIGDEHTLFSYELK